MKLLLHIVVVQVLKGCQYHCSQLTLDTIAATVAEVESETNMIVASINASITEMKSTALKFT